MKYRSIVKREKDDDDDESRVSLASSIIMIMMMMINENIVVKETQREGQSVKINMENWMDEWQTKTNQNEQFETNQKKEKEKKRLKTRIDKNDQIWLDFLYIWSISSDIQRF